MATHPLLWSGWGIAALCLRYAKGADGLLQRRWAQSATRGNNHIAVAKKKARVRRLFERVGFYR